MSIPDAIGYFLGYRLWTVDLRKSYLASVYVDKGAQYITGHYDERASAWKTNDFSTAHCAAKIHKAPYFHCKCGFYGFNSYEDFLNAPYRRDQRANTLLGTALYKGTIIEHEVGFRAEYCKPVALLQDRDRNKYFNKVDDTRLERALYEIGLPIFHNPQELIRYSKEQL